MAAWRIEQNSKGRDLVGSPAKQLNPGRQDFKCEDVVVPITVLDQAVVVHLAEITGDCGRVFVTAKQILASEMAQIADLRITSQAQFLRVDPSEPGGLVVRAIISERAPKLGE